MMTTVERKRTPTPAPPEPSKSAGKKRSYLESLESEEPELEPKFTHPSPLESFLRKPSKKKQKTSNPPVDCPFSDTFFNDMADMISRKFPLAPFAEQHGCDSRDVLHALNAVVLAPLRRPQPWFEGMSVSDNAQILISNWRCPDESSSQANPPSSPSPQIPMGSQQSPILIADDSSHDLSPVSSASSASSDIELFDIQPHEDNDRDSTLRPFSEEGSLDCEQRGVSSDYSETSSAGSVHSAPAVLETDIPSNNQMAMTPVDFKDRFVAKASTQPPARDEDPPSIPEKKASTITRVQCRKAADGSWIPVHKWIEGYHRPAEEERG